MSVIIALAALALLMLAAYRGYSVILFAPIAALGAVLLTDPEAYAVMAEAVNPYGDGEAGARSIAAIRQFFGIGERLPDFDPSV